MTLLSSSAIRPPTSTADDKEQFFDTQVREMIVGYARVSTEEQRLDLQLQALANAGCNRIFEDHGQSGSQFDRKGLDMALRSLRPGGTLVVWRLDRLGRSLSGLVQLIDQLGRRDVNFKSVMENIETYSPGGRLMFHLMAALAEFERAVISERTKAGISAAKSRGANLGRPKALTDEQVKQAFCAIRCGGARLPEVARGAGVSERTLQRYIQRANQDRICRCMPAMSAKPENISLMKNNEGNVPLPRVSQH